MKQQDLTLNSGEQSFVTALLERESFRIARLSEKEKKAKENQAVGELRLKIATDMLVNRVEVKLLQKLITNFMLIIRTMSLPEYDRRIANKPELGPIYEPYIEKHERELDVCEGLIDKLEGLL